jgi:hypothetical protein
MEKYSLEMKDIFWKGVWNKGTKINKNETVGKTANATLPR